MVKEFEGGEGIIEGGEAEIEGGDEKSRVVKAK